MAQTLELRRSSLSERDLCVGPPTRPGLQRVFGRSTVVYHGSERHGDNRDEGTEEGGPEDDAVRWELSSIVSGCD